MQPIDLAHLPSLPPRPDAGHKNSFGTVVVAGGDETMAGAPALAAGAALRIGAGQVRLAVPRCILQTCLTLQPSCTGLPWEVELHTALAAAAQDLHERNWCLALGPGLPPEQLDITGLQMALAAPQVVIDAGGLRALAAAPQELNPQVVLTPHPGEFRALADGYCLKACKAGDESVEVGSPAAPEQAAAELAAACGAIVILKGAISAVAHPDGKVWHLHIANPALATAGSGDVLTGLVAGLLAQGMPAFDAARLAVGIHALAGQTWTEVYGPRGMLAADLIERLPAVAAELAAWHG